MHPIELMLLTMWVESSLSGCFGLLRGHTFQIKSMDGVIGDVLLEVIQYWSLPLKGQHPLIAFRNHSDMEVVTGSVQISSFDDGVRHDLENLLSHPLDCYHWVLKKWFGYKLQFERVCDGNEVFTD